MGKPHILISSQQKFIQLAIKTINYNSKQDRFFAKFTEIGESLPSVLARTQRNPALLYTADDTESHLSLSTCQNLVHILENPVYKKESVI